MLEVLLDERLPGFGPGLSGRNFVLSEIILADVASRSKKARRAPVAQKFSDAIADYSQDKFDVKTAIDGKRQQGDANGWAIGGKPGVHRAVFQLAKPVADKEGVELKLDLAQVFRQGFVIGKFRLWVTDAAKPLAFGLPADVAAALRVPAEKRTAAQMDVVDAYQRFTSPEFDKQQTALWTARLPLPVDPQLVALKTAVTTAEQPVPLDRTLAQLRTDFEQSKQQTADKRLTVVQDLAWALMNSPAFLFNH
jgi:hypothetical protein